MYLELKQNQLLEFKVSALFYKMTFLLENLKRYFTRNYIYLYSAYLIKHEAEGRSEV